VPFGKINWLSEVKTQLWTPRKACSLAKSFGIPTVGRQPRSQGKGGTLETTKSILSDNNMVFCIQKEANESVHRRWSYLVGSSKLSPSLLPSRNILQPNKRNTNPTNIKTYTTERSDYKLKIMLLFHCKTPNFFAPACLVHSTNRISQSWEAALTLGNLTTLGKTKSSLSDINSAFWLPKEAKQSVHMRWSYVCLLWEQSESQNWSTEKTCSSGQQTNWST